MNAVLRSQSPLQYLRYKAEDIEDGAVFSSTQAQTQIRNSISSTK